MGQRTYVGRVTKPCETCQADVTRKASAFRDHVFCSRACYLTSPYFIGRRDASNAQRYEGRRVKRPCRNCGVDVERPISQFNKTTFCSRRCRAAYSVANPVRQRNTGGYVLVFVGRDHPGAGKQGHMLEHRKVMQDHIGRPLMSDEDVHHKNGDRTDNRIENLELWTRSQPRGQRVEDKIAWAKEFLALYGEDI